MSNTWVRELATSGIAVSEEGVRTYERNFLIKVADMQNGPLSALGLLAAHGGTDRFSHYRHGGDFDTGAVLVSLDGPHRDQKEPLLYRVRLGYSSRYIDPEKGDENPLARPAHWGVDLHEFTRVSERDASGKAYLNSARLQFDPLPDMDDMRNVVVVVKNLPTYDAGFLLRYGNAINADPFLGGKPKQWKCLPITAEEQFENGIRYWVHTFRFDYRDEDWTHRVLDQGYTERIFVPPDRGGGPGEYKLKKITDKDGQPISEPAMLDGSGRKLADGEDPVFLEFDKYRELPFNALMPFLL